MCDTPSTLRAIACALRDLQPSWWEVALATYLWPMLTIVVAVLVPVLLSQSAARRAVREAARTAAQARKTTLEAVRLQIDSETRRARAEKRREVVAELLAEVDRVFWLPLGRLVPPETHTLRLLSARLRLELDPEDKAMQDFVGDIAVAALRIRQQADWGVNGEEAMAAWWTGIGSTLTVWAQMEMTPEAFAASRRPDLLSYVQQGPAESDDMNFRRIARLRAQDSGT